MAELQNRVKTDSQHGVQQTDNRQRFELTSQGAPSTTLSQAREKIETEPVQQALKKRSERDQLSDRRLQC